MHTRHAFAVFAVGLAMLLSTGFAYADVTPDDLGEGSALFWQALDEMGLDYRDVRFDLTDFGFYNQDKYIPHLLTAYLDNPWKVSPYTHCFTDSLVGQQPSLANTLTSVQGRIDQGVRITLIGDPLAEYMAKVEEYGVDNLAIALAELNSRDYTEFIDEDYRSLPEDVRDAAALFCFAVDDVQELRWGALSDPVMNYNYDPDWVFDKCVDWALELPDEKEDESDRESAVLIEYLLDNVDFQRLNTGATLLAACVERMELMLAEHDAAGDDFCYSVDTIYGDLVLSGAADDDYPGDYQHVLILDTGGNDHYSEAGSTRHWWHPVSVVIDLGGDDVYRNLAEADYRLRVYYDEDHPDYTGAEYHYSRVPAFGAGVLGYGMLLDAAGDDVYDSQFIGQGCGIFGTGMLVDRAGDDEYIGVTSVQGSGWFGTGVLIDNQGDDHYELYRYGQGFGFTGGVGLLLDCDGTDTYIANNEDIVYDSVHSPVINLNLAQGFGYGRRDDYGEGHSWGGGVGMLIDAGTGDDTYDCGIYALGSSYWAAVGILRDYGGNDRYMSAHYTLAAPPHYSCGVFIDDQGDDVYYGYLRQTLGHGRDWSLGWFEDGGGDDWYQAGHQSLGQGDVNSIGVFWDKGGDDIYLLHGPGFGQTTTADSSVVRTGAPGSIRWYQFCLGLFIDGGGYDQYFVVPEELPFTGDIDDLEPSTIAANGTVWHCGDSIDAPNSHSVGIDAE
ncbi:hypothetical protein JW859_13280 [bacterium]|nr:hypothetical protein [bacterium]